MGGRLLNEITDPASPSRLQKLDSKLLLHGSASIQNTYFSDIKIDFNHEHKHTLADQMWLLEEEAEGRPVFNTFELGATEMGTKVAPTPHLNPPTLVKQVTKVTVMPKGRLSRFRPSKKPETKLHFRPNER
jgi:hypothetical protein